MRMCVHLAPVLFCWLPLPCAALCIMRMCVHLAPVLLAPIAQCRIVRNANVCALGDSSVGSCCALWTWWLFLNYGKQYHHLKHFLMSSLGFLISMLIFALFVVYGQNPRVSKTIMIIQFIEGSFWLQKNLINHGDETGEMRYKWCGVKEFGSQQKK